MKKAKHLLIGAFIVFLLIPAIQHVHPVFKAEKVEEKRTTIQFPSGHFWKSVWEDPKYTVAIEQYFSDNFPLRDFLLRCLGQLEYSLLGTSKEVILGTDQWMSDKRVLSEQLHTLDQVSDGQIQAAVIQIKRLQYWLQRQGTDFLMVVIPMKPTIYAEKFPKRYVQRPELTGLLRFQAKLQKNDIPFINAYELLKSKKDEQPLYFKTDMHWNSVGAGYVAQAIVNHFSEKLEGRQIWRESYRKTEVPVFGEELKTIPLFFASPEMAPDWSGEQRYRRAEEVRGARVGTYFGTDQEKAVLPPSIMFGNSFMLRYPDVGYHDYFKESYRVLDYEDFSKVLDYVKPQHKLFVLHVYETQLLFHVLALDNSNYWDKRVKDLPLPNSFVYQ